jgi:hypothetical protein
MALALSDYISQVRPYLDDTDTSHRVVDNLTTLVVGGNGLRKSFPLSHINLVAGKTLADVNKAGFLSTGFLVDLANAIVTFSTAPPLSGTVPTSLEILSYYQEFTDDQLTPLINYGLNKIGVNSISVDAAYANVLQPNFNVVCLYAASQGYSILSGRYAKFVDTSAEGKSSSKSTISENYLKLAQEYEERATLERLAVQGARQGRSTSVSTVKKSFQPSASNWAPNR